MTFLKTILTIILIYYAFKLILRILAPILMKKAAEQIGKKFEEKFNQQQQNTQQQPYQNNAKKEKKKIGEYIDYEEVD